MAFMFVNVIVKKLQVSIKMHFWKVLNMKQNLATGMSIVIKQYNGFAIAFVLFENSPCNSCS